MNIIRIIKRLALWKSRKSRAQFRSEEATKKELSRSLIALRQWTHRNHAALLACEDDLQKQFITCAIDIHEQICSFPGLSHLRGKNLSPENSGQEQSSIQSQDYNFQPVVTNGKAAYYYGTLVADSQHLFIKVSPPGRTNMFVMQAWINDSQKEGTRFPLNGDRVRCELPLQIIRIPDVADVHIYPFRPKPKGARNAHYDNEVVIQGLAQFSVALRDVNKNRVSHGAQSYLDEFNLELRSLSPNHFKDTNLSRDQINRHLEIHSQILTLWKAKTKTFDSLPRGFVHGDFGLTNFYTQNDRLYMIDLDTICIGPLGTDFAWMLFYSQRIKDPIKRRHYIESTIEKFANACNQLGEHVTEKQILCAAQVGFFLKWLFPGKGTQADITQLKKRQEDAIEFLETLDV